MQTITTIGLDIAKSVFQFHGVDAGGQAVIRRQLKRRNVLAFFYRSLRVVAPLVARAQGTASHRAVDAAAAAAFGILLAAALPAAGVESFSWRPKATSLLQQKNLAEQ
jgi:transposase